MLILCGLCSGRTLTVLVLSSLLHVLGTGYNINVSCSYVHQIVVNTSI